MDQSHLIAQQVKNSLPANLPQLDPAALSRLKEQALNAARQLQQQVTVLIHDDHFWYINV
jgi:hypothetical protein